MMFIIIIKTMKIYHHEFIKVMKHKGKYQIFIKQGTTINKKILLLSIREQSENEQVILYVKHHKILLNSNGDVWWSEHWGIMEGLLGYLIIYKSFSQQFLLVGNVFKINNKYLGFDQNKMLCTVQDLQFNWILFYRVIEHKISFYNGYHSWLSKQEIVLSLKNNYITFSGGQVLKIETQIMQNNSILLKDFIHKQQYLYFSKQSSISLFSTQYKFLHKLQFDYFGLTQSQPDYFSMVENKMQLESKAQSNKLALTIEDFKCILKFREIQIYYKFKDNHFCQTEEREQNLYIEILSNKTFSLFNSEGLFYSYSKQQNIWLLSKNRFIFYSKPYGLYIFSSINNLKFLQLSFQTIPAKSWCLQQFYNCSKYVITFDVLTRKFLLKDGRQIYISNTFEPNLTLGYNMKVCQQQNNAFSIAIDINPTTRYFLFRQFSKYSWTSEKNLRRIFTGYSINILMQKTGLKTNTIIFQEINYKKAEYKDITRNNLWVCRNSIEYKSQFNLLPHNQINILDSRAFDFNSNPLRLYTLQSGSLVPYYSYDYYIQIIEEKQRNLFTCRIFYIEFGLKIYLKKQNDGLLSTNFLGSSIFYFNYQEQLCINSGIVELTQFAYYYPINNLIAYHYSDQNWNDIELISHESKYWKIYSKLSKKYFKFAFNRVNNVWTVVLQGSTAEQQYKSGPYIIIRKLKDLGYKFYSCQLYIFHFEPYITIWFARLEHNWLKTTQNQQIIYQAPPKQVTIGSENYTWKIKVK